MKLTKEQKIRLALLRAKAVATRTADEVAELGALTLMAQADESIEPDLSNDADLTKCAFQLEFGPDAVAAAKAKEDAEKALTEPELEALVQKSLVTVMTNHGITDQSAILEELKGRKSLTSEDVEKAIEKHLTDGKTDPKEIASAVKSALPAAITADQFTKAFDNLAETLRDRSKNEFKSSSPGALASPIEHRSGNLAVHEKQMLNLCLKGVSDEAIAQCKSVRPVGMNDGISKDQLEAAASQGAQHLKSVRQSVVYGQKAITTGGAGTGLELVPSDLASQLQARMYLESQLAAAMVASEIVMPTATFKFPLKTTRTRFYSGSENPGADPTSSQPGTSEITLDAKKLIGMAEYSYESDEDMIVPILPMLQEDLASGAADALENALINGDTAATQDSDATAGDDITIFDGLRKLCLAGGTPASTAAMSFTTAGLMGLRKSMLRWGIRPADMFLLVGVKGYNKLLSLTETLTVDKYGPSATVLNGAIGQFAGVPIVVSHRVREDLAGTGKFDGSNTDDACVFMVHRPSWLVGVKRGFTVEVEVDRKRQMNAIIASFRRDFVPKETISSTVPLAWMGYGFAG